MRCAFDLCFIMNNGLGGRAGRFYLPEIRFLTAPGSIMSGDVPEYQADAGIKAEILLTESRPACGITSGL
ncbi:hypothetical protein ACJ4_00320 [Pantoea sp. QMID4]|nr:hypothetical protein ACJ4_00320 [Pantoea sp. QMID4]